MGQTVRSDSGWYVGAFALTDRVLVLHFL